MATYKTGNYEDWNGVLYYSIKKRTLFGWREEKYWTYSDIIGRYSEEDKTNARKKMEECMDRLIKAGHTVL